MTPKEFAKKIIASINPGTADISGIGDGTIKGAISELNSKLINENSETFNFGVKDGVRGFFTDPSRADDSFVPFSSSDMVYVPMTNNLNHTVTKNTNGFVLIASVTHIYALGCFKINNKDYTALGTYQVIRDANTGDGFGSTAIYFPYELKKGDILTAYQIYGDSRYSFGVVY